MIELQKSTTVVDSAFSLIELLVVMAIIGFMSGLTMLAMQGASQRGRSDFAVEQVRAQIDIARQTAMTMNTYCYVALGKDGDNLYVAGIQSLNGQPASGSAILPVSGNFTLCAQTQKASGVIVEDELPPADRDKFKDLPADTLLNKSLQPKNASSQFSIPKAGAAGSTVSSTHVIEFNPTGEAAVRVTNTALPSSSVQLAIVPCAGSQPSERERAKTVLLWVNGATGHTEVYER